MTDSPVPSPKGGGEPPAKGFLVLLTITMGVCLAAEASWAGSFGLACVLAAPFTVGFANGYFFHASGFGCFGWTAATTAVAVALTYLTGAAGPFCLAMGLMLMFLPLAFGSLVGSVCRSSWKAGRLAPPMCLFLMTAAALWLEPRLTAPHAPETVVTARVLPMDRDAAWNAIVFYGDVDAPPPLLTSIGLPRPLGTTGIPSEVGARTQCEYTTGRIEKLITQLRAGELLAFEVTEQVGVEDRSVELLSGSFSFEDAPGGGTLVTLRTTYRPLLDARAAWRPLERAVCRDLHLHVLRGMELQEAVDSFAYPEHRPSRASLRCPDPLNSSLFIDLCALRGARWTAF